MRYLQVLLVHIPNTTSHTYHVEKIHRKMFNVSNFTSLLCFSFFYYLYLYIHLLLLFLKVFIVFIVLFYPTVFFYFILFSFEFYVLQIEFQYQENLSRNNTHSTVSLLRSFFFLPLLKKNTEQKRFLRFFG